MTVAELTLSEVCEINPRIGRDHGLTDAALVSFVPMAAVDEIAGSIRDRQTRAFGEVRKGFTHFRDGDVLFAKITPCMENGKSTIARDLVCGVGFGSTEFHVIRAGSNVLPEWIFYFVRQKKFRDLAKRNFTGTAGQQRVSTNFLASTKIPVPSLSEQRRIVDLLTRAEGIVRLRRDAQQRAAELIPAIFRKMFGDPESNPRGLQLRKVSDFVAQFQGGKNIQAGSEDPTGLRILKVSAVTSGRYLEKESKPAPDNYVAPASHFVKVGDMLFSRANTVELVGATALIEATDGQTLLPDKLWRIIWSEDVDVVYMHTLFQDASVRRVLGKLATGTSDSMRNISQGKLFDLELPVASLPEQRKFGLLASQAMGVISTQELGLVKARESFDSLMSQAFGG